MVRLESGLGTCLENKSRRLEETHKKELSGKCVKFSRITKLFGESVPLVLMRKVIGLSLNLKWWKESSRERNISGPLLLKAMMTPLVQAKQGGVTQKREQT